MPRPPRIVPGIRVLSSDGPLLSGSSDGSYWGRGRVLVKPLRSAGSTSVGFEFLAARLLAALGLPTPAGETGAELDGRLAWVSTVVDLEGEDVAPPDPHDVVERYPDLAAGIFVFDVWTLNGDRNEENLIAHDRLGLWAIDHEYAFAALRNADPMASVSEPLTYHAFLDLSLDPERLHDWGERVMRLGTPAIERAVHEGYERRLYTAPVRDGLQRFLLRRRDAIHRLVERSRPVIRTLSDVDNPADEGARS